MYSFPITGVYCIKMYNKNLALFAWLQAQTQDVIDELDFVSKIRDYYYSTQPDVLTPRQREYMGLKDGDEEPRDNFIDDTIQLISERLYVTGWQASHISETESQKLNLAIQTIMENNDMDSTQDDVYTSALRDGCSFIIVDYDTSKAGLEGVRFQVLPSAYINYDNGNEQIMGVRLHKDTYGKVTFASNRYVDYDITNDGPINKDIKINQFLTIYNPDKIERYIMRGAVQDSVNSDFAQAGWERYTENPGDPWPIPWTTNGQAGGEPLGVPVFEFETPDGSVINRSLLSIQDAVNRNFSDTIALDYLHGFALLVITGVALDDDEVLSPGRVINIQDNEASVNRIAGESSSNLHETKRTYIQSVARKTTIPIHLIFPTSTPPTGESLKRMESRIINRCLRIQRNYGKAWINIAEMSLKLALVFGGETGLLLDAINQGSVNPIWAKPYSATVEENATEAAAYKASGLPDEYGWAEVWGLTPQEIAKYSALKQSATNQAVVSAVSALQQVEQAEQEQENG